MTVMITGHRKLVPFNNHGSEWPDRNPAVAMHHESIKHHLMNYCKVAFDNGHRDFISGMALGADQLFAEAVIEFKRLGYEATLIAAVPFLGQESKWPEHSKNRYHEIIQLCDRVETICPPGYAPWKMQNRNEWMVDRSEIVLALWDGIAKGGTYNCLTYALSNGKFVVQLDPQTHIYTRLHK